MGEGGNMIKHCGSRNCPSFCASVMVEELLMLRVALVLREKKFWFHANFAYIVTYNPTLLLS